MKENIRYFVQNKGKPFVIEISGKSWCDGSYIIQRDDPDIWVLEYIVKGQGCIEIRGEKFYPQVGDVYLLPPHIAHCYYSDDKNPWTKLFLNLQGRIVDGLADAYGLRNIILFPDVTSQISERFGQIYQMMKTRESEEEQILFRTEMLVHEIFYFLGNAGENLIKESEEIRKVKNYLNAHMSESISIEQLAGLIYHSPDYLIRHFKEETGTTPYRYLISQRLDAARKLLDNTAMSVGEIGEQTGYSDPQYFSNVFHKEMGMSPMQYRKRNERRKQK